MRRRPIIVLLLTASALAGAAIALADAPATSPAVKALAEAPDAQVGPAVAVNPAGGSPSIAAAALGTDWRSGVLAPQSGFSSGTITAASGVTSWGAEGLLPHTGSDVSRGSPDVVWGPGNKVYAVEEGRDTANVSNPCLSGAGIYLFVSSNGGASWNTVDPVSVQSNNASYAFSEPSIAYDAVSGRIYIAYTRTQPCTAKPGDPGSQSFTRLATLTRDDAVGGVAPSSVSPGAANSQFVHPSVTALPGGTAAVAYFDASDTGSGQVDVTICNPATGPACNVPTVIDNSATDPGTRSVGGVTLAVHVRPKIASDATGRAIVTWSELTATGGMDVFSATSRDGGATFGAPQPVSPTLGASDQLDPDIAIAPGDGRADIAFLDSRYSASGYLVAASASNRPIGASTTESWSSSVPVESAPILPVAPTVPGVPTLGARIGIAEVPRATGRPWALIAWADSRNANAGTPRNTDVYSTVLLHGATPPVAAPDASATVPVQRRVQTTVAIKATDAEADPLTYTIVGAPQYGQATIPDPNQPSVVYQAPTALVADQIQVRVDDGVGSTIVTLNVQVVNTPPVIVCDNLSTAIDTALPLTTADCVTDANFDPVSLDASAPVHGVITRADGILRFIPDTGFTGRAQVTLMASDGTDGAVKTITITVGAAGAVAVQITGEQTRTAYVGRPIALRASLLTASADASLIEWSYGDGTGPDKGPSVTHLFSHVDTYYVTARVGDGPPDTVKVLVQQAPLVITRTDISSGGTMSVRVETATSGKLSIGLLGVHGVHPKKITLKRGKRTVRMKLPAAARQRGTVILKLSFALGNGGTAKLKRAVLIPPA